MQHDKLCALHCTPARALDRRFDQKRIIGTEPYGYTLLHDGTLTDNVVEQAVIHKMQAWRQAGCSYNRIAQQLNREGVPTKTRKGKWQCGNVAGVLGSKHTGRIIEAEYFQSKIHEH